MADIREQTSVGEWPINAAVTPTRGLISSANDSGRVNSAQFFLPDQLRQLNRIYLDRVASRSLLTASESCTWLDRHVTVFLRHDKVSVFAIVCDEEVGMADFVSLTDVTFHVNEPGRIQSNAEQGPLPSQRTIHAYLTGRLGTESRHAAVTAIHKKHEGSRKG